MTGTPTVEVKVGLAPPAPVSTLPSSLIPGGVGVTPSEAGAWVTSHAYTKGEIVTHAGQRYECLLDHTSGTFAADLAALKWVLLGVDPASSVALPADSAGWLHDDGSGAYVWSTPTAANVGAVPTGGGTMTGPLVLPGPPTASLQAANKGYADSIASGAAALPSGFRVMQPPTVTSGDVYLIGGASTSNIGGIDTNGWLIPFMLDAAGTFYLGCSVTGASSAGGVLRFAVYTDANLTPATATDLGTVIATGGTDVNNASARYGTGTVALNSGQRYWAALVSQGGATTQPTLRAVPSPGWSLPAKASLAGPAYRSIVSGAWGNTPTLASVGQSAPSLFLKAA